METLIIFISLINWYYFAIKWIFEKESKDKIFYIVFMTIVFILVMMIIQMLWLWFINFIIYFIFLFIVHSFYTDFAFLTKINEYFLRNAKQEEFSIRIIIVKLLNKELKILKQEIFSIFTNKENIYDIVQITIWMILMIFLSLHIFWVIDIFLTINKLFL